MAPPQGRKRKEATSAGSSSSRNKFRSRAHQERFEDSVVNKKPLKEKGFVLGENEYIEIQLQIRARGWGKLRTNPK